MRTTIATAGKIDKDTPQIASGLRCQGDPESLFELVLAQPATSMVLSQEIGAGMSLFVADTARWQAAHVRCP